MAFLAGPRARLARAPRPLLALLVISAVLAVAWSLAVAPLQGPDERSHAAYVQYLAETGHVPSAVAGTHDSSTEIATAVSFLNLLPLEGIEGAKPATGDAEIARWEELERSFTDAQRSDGSGPNPLGKNPPLFYLYDAVPYKVFGTTDLFTRLTAMRMASALLHVLAVLAMWLLAGELVRSRWLQTLATGLYAFQPMTTHLGSVINADSMLATVWVALALFCVRAVKRGPTMANVLWVCGLGAASVLTHGRGLAAVPVVLVALAVAVAVHRPAAGVLLRRVAAGAVLAAVPLLVYRLAFTTPGAGGALFGAEATGYAKAFNVRELISWTWQFYFGPFASLARPPGPDYGYRQVFIESYLGGTFASLEVTYPLRVYDALQMAAGAGLLALLAAVVARWRALLAHWPVVLVLGATVVATLGLLHVASYQALVGNRVDPLITGRYLTPVTAAYALAATFVVWTLPRRVQPYAGAALLAGALLLQLAAIGLTGMRFYA